MRILCVVATLDVGGAERVMCNLANAFAELGLDTSLAAGCAAGELRNSVAPAVTVINLQSSRMLTGIPRLLQTVWRLRPDVVLTAGTHVNALVGCVRWLFPGNTQVIARETSVLEQVLSTREGTLLSRLKGHVLKFVVGRGYPFLNRVVCQNKRSRADIIRYGRVSPDNVATIYNPVSFRDVRAQSARMLDPFPSRDERFPAAKRVVVVGRLEKVKAFERVVSAVPALVAKYPGSTLTLVGDGSERESLMSLSRSLHIEKHVRFVGCDMNPWKWMKHADLFVLSSKYDNMPNVLIEAIACECPVVSLPIPGGVEELLASVHLQHRTVQDLCEWDECWFAPLRTENVNRASELFDAPRVARKYLDLMC